MRKRTPGRRLPVIVALAFGCAAAGCDGTPTPTAPQADLQVPTVPPVRKGDPNGRSHIPVKPAGKPH